MSSDIHNSLAGIPIRVVGTHGGNGRAKYRWKRRAVQGIFLLLIVLIPLSGLFRIDPVNGAMVVLDWQIWFADFFLVTGLWIMIACLMIGLYSLAGTVFCGWACPQNTLAEWANHLTRRLLGKRAEVSWSGDAPIVAAGKNRALNWSLLGLSFILVAMFFALVPLLYFYPADVIWSFIIGRQDARLAGSLYWIYTVWVMIILLDIAVLRHFWCRFACVYRVWQHTFKTRETLHVLYDDSRSSECAKCNYCVTTCFLGLDPKNTMQYDSCINCGDCIDACNKLQSKKGNVGLLSFEFGERTRGGNKFQLRDNTMSLLSRFKWTFPFAVFGLIMFIWGTWSYQPYHLSVGYLESERSHSSSDYRIEVASKRYRPSELAISIEGLPANSYSLSTSQVDLETVGRASVRLSMSHDLQHGLYPFWVVVHSSDGWTGRFNVRHFVE